MDSGAPNFLAHGRHFRFSPRSLGCIPVTNVLRQRVVWLVTSKAFENFILALIVFNSISLGMVDFSNVDPVTYQPVTEVRVTSPRPHRLPLTSSPSRPASGFAGVVA